MKTMTCSQLGGACDLPLVGEDANEIIHAQDRHLREAVAAGRSDHEQALRDMKGRWRRPVSGNSRRSVFAARRRSTRQRVTAL